MNQNERQPGMNSKRLPGMDGCMEVVFNKNDAPYVADFFGRSRHVCACTQKGQFSPCGYLVVTEPQ